MKTIKYLSAAVLFGFAGIISMYGQDAEKQVKKGQIRLMIEENNNGKVVKCDSTFSIEDQAKVEAILKAKGIEWTSVNEFKFKSDEDEVVIINNEEINEDDVKVVKVMKFESDGNSDEEIDIEVIINDAVNHAMKLENNFEFSDEDVKVIRVQKEVDGNDSEEIFELKGDGVEKVIVKQYVVTDDRGDVDEVVASIKSKMMVFIVDPESSNKNEENLLPTKIEEDELENLEITKLKLYPNPTNGNFNMSFKSQKAKDINLSITDTKGSKIFEKELRNFKGKFNQDFDLSNQESGIYFFNIISGTERETRKVIVQ